MTDYLLDTNVVSELARKLPDPRVLAWLRQLPAIRLPAIAVFELASGIERMAAGRRRTALEQWLWTLLEDVCEILALDRESALASATIAANARRLGRAIEYRDLLILGIARTRSAAIATRNVAHFRGLGVPVYDPFTDLHVL